MKRLVCAAVGAALGAAASAAVLSISVASPAQAGYGDAPWCAVINAGDSEMYWDCQYQTFAACQPHVVAGNRGFCNLNPTYRPAAAGPAHRSSRRRN